MSKLHLICVGKLKDKNFKSIEDEYFKRLKTAKINIHETKANAENQKFEGQEVLKKIKEIHSSSQVILLAEKGKEFDTKDFSSWLQNKIENTSSPIVFVIAGAQGHSDEILAIPHTKLSLSKLTMPHQMARVVFVEQIYRAQTLWEGHPYHN